MRRLTRRDDRGLATILVVLALPALLMMGSLVFDGARGLLAAREAQNAADAAALAKATDSANANGCANTDLSGYATNGTTFDSASCPTSTTAKATMSKNITEAFSAGRDTRTVTRSATATWGVISSATTVPAVISACVFDIATSNGTVFPSTEQVIPIGGGSTNCPGRPPGNFGWLDRTAGSCAVTTTLTAAGTVTAGGDNGNGTGLPYECINGVSGGGLNAEILIPIYTNLVPQGTGTNVTYTISGFAQFHITGWDLKHGTPSAYPPGGIPSCTVKNCIRGYFVKFVTGQGSPGSGSNFGALTVRLSS